MYTSRLLHAVAALLVLAITQGTIGSAASFAIDVSAEERNRLAAGESIVRVSEAERPADGAIFAAIDIPASPERTWAVLYDCAGAPAFMDNLKSCDVLEAAAGGAWDVRRHVVSWTSFLPEVRSVFHSDYETNRRIRFRRVDGDLTYLDGEWRLQPLNGGRATRLIYQVRVGFHALVPSFMVRGALESDIPNFLKTIRGEVLRRSPS